MSEDPYRWLEDLESPATRAFLAEQERRTREILDGVPDRDHWRALLERKVRRPHAEPLGGGFFLERETAGERAVLTQRCEGTAEGTVLLDPGAWKAGTSLAFAVPSPHGSHVAVGRATAGHDARIRILEVSSGRFLPGRPPGRDHSHVSWLPDGSGFYYTACPEGSADPDHWRSVHRYSLASSEAARIFGEDRIRDYWCSAEVSECGRYAVLYKYDFVHACEVYLQRLGDPDLVPVVTGMDSLSRVQVLEDHLLIHTDRDAPRGRCCLAPLSSPGNWRTLIPEGEHVLQTVTGAGDRLYAVWALGVHQAVTVHDLQGALLREVQLPSLGSVSHHDGDGWISGVSGRWRGDEVRIRFGSVLQPEAVYIYDYATDRLFPEHVRDPGFPAEEYVTEQVHYPSTDGTLVPMLLVRHRDAPRDGRRAVRLTGYGGFGLSLTPAWTPFAATWLELGGILAYAGIRGGGEYGREWHQAGRGCNRQRVFDDHIAAARWLAESGWTRPDRLLSRGNSNGGLMVTVAAMQAPEVFGAVISRAGLMDMLTFPRFGFLSSATVEYGDPAHPDDAAYLAGYSPYHNVRPDRAYPPLLFIAPLEDRISPPYDPVKMTARLQAEASAGGPYLLLPLHSAGHGGGTKASEAVAHDLDELCFCAWALGRDGNERFGLDHGRG